MSVTNKKHPLLFNYTADGNTLTRVKDFKYLGLIISDDLHWDKHIDTISSKAMSTLYYLKRSLRNASSDTKLLAYKTLILPILDYANIIWDPYTAVNLRKVERVQNKAVRFIFNSYGITSVSQLVARASLKQISARNRICRLLFMFKLVKRRLHSRTSDYVEFSSGYATRQRHPFSLVPFKNRNNVFKYSFIPRTVIDWNDLNAHVVTENDIDRFQIHLES